MTHLILLLALQQPPTLDEILKLARDGAKEEELLRKVEGTKFKLSADDVVALKKAGVGEKVIALMIEGPRDAKVVNLAHKAVSIRVNGATIEVGTGESVPRGSTVRLAASGEYAVTVNGRPTSCSVKTPATLTFRGCDLDDFEVLTLYIDDVRGKDTCLVESNVRR